MAIDKGVPVIKLHLDKEQVHEYNIEPYLKALFEAMKTKPKSEERTVTYYGGGRGGGGAHAAEGHGQGRGAEKAEIDTDGDGFLSRAE